MKLYHPDKTVTSCSFDGQSIERGEDGSFDAPDGAVDLLHHGFTTQKPSEPAPPPSGLQGDHADDDEDGADTLVKLAKATKAEIAAYAFQAYGAELDTTKKKDDLLLAVADLAAKAADEALRVQAEEEAKAARLAELEAKPAEDLTEEEVAELAALKPAPAVEE